MKRFKEEQPILPNDFKANIASSPNVNNVNDTRNVKADFNFYGGVTQEALPQIKKYINESFKQFEKKVPEIASVGQMWQLRGMGFAK